MIVAVPNAQVPLPAELDELTLKRAQRGDDEACRALVHRYQAPVFALVGRMLGSRRQSVVEDVAQETFLQVFRSLEKFSPLGAARLSTWILTIASRRAIDELRRAEPPSEPLRDEALPAGARADETARRKAMAAAIRGAVNDLAPPYRAAFLPTRVSTALSTPRSRALWTSISEP